MCPEASARMRTPRAATAKPVPREIHVGRANQKYVAAKRKPRGTRDRVATRDQLGIAASQQVAGGGNPLSCGNLQQSGFNCSMVRKRGLAFRMPQRNYPGAKRASSFWIGGAI